MNDKRIYSSLLIIVALLALAIGFLSSSADRREIYEPKSESGEGFVGKGNDLLTELLSFSAPGRLDRDSLSILDLLNHRYPAFEFAVPEGAESQLNTLADIRLVGIRESYIDSLSKTDREFYYNSDLPKLLRRQRALIHKRFFHIRFGNPDQRGAVIKRIELSREMLKVKFSTKRWEGNILSQNYSRVGAEAVAYMLINGHVLPLKSYQSTPEKSMPVNVAVGDSPGSWADIDDDYFQNAEMRKFQLASFHGLEVCLVRDSNSEVERIVLTNCKNMIIHAYSRKGVERREMGTNASDDATSFVLGREENFRMRIVVNYRGDHHDTCEFIVLRTNPLCLLSEVIHTNSGRLRKQMHTNYSDIFVRQLTDYALQNQDVYQARGIDTISFSIDPLLSSTLEREIRRYMEEPQLRNLLENPGDRLTMSVCVIDAATGELLAAPSWTNIQGYEALSDERRLEMRNHNMLRLPIGSCFKPLLALATTQWDHRLLSYTPTIIEEPEEGKKFTYIITGHSGQRYVFRGMRHHSTSSIDMQSFLSQSNNIYPLALAVQALGERRNSLLGNQSFNSIIERGPFGSYMFIDAADMISTHPFLKLFDSMYDVKSEEEMFDVDSVPKIGQYMLRIKQKTKGKDVLATSMSLANELSPDYVNMHYQGWANATLRGELASWVWGNGSNHWSPLKLAEAWARMLTRRKVELTYFHVSDRQSHVEAQKLLYNEFWDQYEQQDSTVVVDRRQAWSDFLDIFNRAQRGGTLLSVFNSLQAVDTDLMVLGKTGTPIEEIVKEYEYMSSYGKGKYRGMGLYTAAILPRHAYEALKRNERVTHAGVVLVVRLDLRTKSKQGLLNSSYAKSFLSSERLRMLRSLLYQVFYPANAESQID